MSAGAAEIAFQKGTSFDSYGATFYRPGKDLSVDQFQITNNRQGIRALDEVVPGESVEGAFEGVIGLTYTMDGTRHGDVRDIVFSSGGTNFTSGLAPTSKWYVGTDYLDTSFNSQTVELELASCIPRSYSLTYEVDTNTVRENLVLAFADVTLNASKTPSSVSGTTTGREVAFHGVEVTVDTRTVNRNQALTLEFPEPMYRYHREDSTRNPVSAVQNGVDPRMTSRVIYHTEDFLGLALSGDDNTATSVTDVLGEVSGDVAFSDSNGVVARYNFSNLGLDQWQGQNFVATENDFEGVSTWMAHNMTSITTS